jgi:hypothetical protein
MLDHLRGTRGMIGRSRMTDRCTIQKKWAPFWKLGGNAHHYRFFLCLKSRNYHNTTTMARNVHPSAPTSANKKYQPAYEGAKFDKSGYCLKHPMILLCKPTNSGGSDTTSSELPLPDRRAAYKIVRKVCPMCGEHSLVNERKFQVVSPMQQ